ncbi:MAG: hypothetical protein M1818_007894 [Claussenomyces sp. TS43310]|nr:MAG: hypothetical protein M1818_007894 [Claussenomyces sp. TS43310]
MKSSAGEAILVGPSSGDREDISWLLTQPASDQERLAKDHFRRLLRDAAQPRHMSGNACIKLCFFLEQCRKSPSQILRDLVFSKDVCFHLFNFYIEWNEKSQHRSMRQVLELLATLLITNPSGVDFQEYKVDILRRLLSIIAHESAQPLVKPAFKALEGLLGKHAVTVADMVRIYSSRKQTATPANEIPSNPEMLDCLVSDMFYWMSLPDTSPAAGKLLVTLFKECRKNYMDLESFISLDAHSILWGRWIRDGLSKQPESLEYVKNYLFPPLFKLDRAEALDFLDALAQENELETLQRETPEARSFLLLAAMEVGKKLGLVVDGGEKVTKRSTLMTRLTTSGAEPPLKSDSKSHKCVLLPEATIGGLLTHASSAIRSSALSVLISSNLSTRPFSDEALKLLRDHLFILHADTDAKFRNDLLSNTKHLIERIRNVMANFARDFRSCPPGSIAPEVQQSKRLESHQNFVRWYINFLANELVPTAAYQRHVTALKALHMVLKSDIMSQLTVMEPSRSFSSIVFQPSLIRLLLDLILDPFDDVRSTATLIVQMAPIECFRRPSPTILRNEQAIAENEKLGLLQDFIARGEEVSKRTGRADTADGVARSQALLFNLMASKEDQLKHVESLVSSLETKVSIAEQDLGKAVSVAPIHAQFAALRLVWETVLAMDISAAWLSLQERIVVSCQRIWKVVRDVLCNDSPEGHLPSDLEELEVMDTKDVLSYSFRAIHESSNLLRSLVSKLQSRSINDLPLVSYETFRTIGDLTFDQLASLRHRGAFSTVSLTFAKCCQLSQDRAILCQPGIALLESWYKGALACIHEQTSTTRRSAGIPALVTGILSAGAVTPAFGDVMQELQSLATQPVFLSDVDETNLPQVHAMNCLKDIFRSSILGKRAESHIASCLELAADSLQSDTWAVRNCGLILLRSLIDCLFGTNESKTVTEAGWDGKSIRLSYDRYPALPELLLKLLKLNLEDGPLRVPVIGAVESVFPALDILRRAGPPVAQRKEILDSVSAHLDSKVWHIRDIAARTIATLLLHDNWLADLLPLLDGRGACVNRQHGILVSLKYVLERHLELGTSNLPGM